MHAAPPGRWLRKNPRSSGGLGVRFADRGDADGYLQEFIDGVSMSALFVSGSDGVELLDVTEQLIGVPWLHASGFLYCGNVGPVVPSPAVLDRILATGEALHGAAGLRGLWGLDFVLRGGVPYPVEVNPRYTASVEVLEHATGRSAMARHAAAFGYASESGRGSGVRGVVGKAVYFAPRDLTFPADGPWEHELTGPFDPWRLPGHADVPAAGERIARGRPVLTFFTSAATAGECRERLKERALEFDQCVSIG